MAFESDMERVPITRLKANLAHYLAKLKAGRSFLVTDRGHLVAVFEPFAFDSSDETTRTLLTSGLATPEIAKLQERLAARDESSSMISLSLDESDDLARRHAERHGIRWPQAWIGMDSPMRERYGVAGAPTYVVVDPRGRSA